jgi:hypothetical protein
MSTNHYIYRKTFNIGHSSVVMTLSEEIRKHLGLPRGGYVKLWKREDGVVELSKADVEPEQVTEMAKIA